MGPPLFEALIANAVFLCDADALLHWNSAAEEGAWGGLKTGPPRRHQIHIQVSRARHPIPARYSLHGHILEVVDHAKYLGVNIASDLKWIVRAHQT